LSRSSAPRERRKRRRIPRGFEQLRETVLAPPEEHLRLLELRGDCCSSVTRR
jgi:hypothetical protein